MRLLVPLLLACSLSPVYAAYVDGLISPGEYEWYVEWLSGTLVVDGGGAAVIDAADSSAELTCEQRAH